MSTESNRELKEVERSPDGRYIRFDSKLGDGAYKAVWLAYDTELGIDVAWCLVETKRIPPRERERIRSETEILSHLHHQHIINFYQVWENPGTDQIVFTTERVTSGSLKQYINRVKPLKLKVIKKWCRQILKGLEYLHSQNPPVIHRDLKCDNIFIHGNNGELRIGDLGLSTMRSQTHVVSVLGTPEFMAPELYDEYYTEKVDIYAFGMCVLEMVTNEYPYQECTNPAQIYRKVTQKIPPESLSKIKHLQTKEFIKFCIAHPDVRPSASELLEHPFLAGWNTDYRDSADAGYVFAEVIPLSPVVKQQQVPEGPILPPTSSNPNANVTAPPSNTTTHQTAAQPDVSFQEVLVENVSGNVARIILRIHLKNKRQEIKFPFDLTSDTAESVASEMVREIGLATSARLKLADAIFDSIRGQKEKWKNLVRQKREAFEIEDRQKQGINRNPSHGSFDSNEAVISNSDHKDQASEVEDLSSLSINTLEGFMKEGEQLNALQLVAKISELSKETINTRGLEKKELVKLYAELRSKANTQRRLSQLDMEIGAAANLPGSSKLGSAERSGSPGASKEKDLSGKAEITINEFDSGMGKGKGADAEFIKLILEKKSFPLSADQTNELKLLEAQRNAKLKQHKKTYLKNKIQTNREYNFLAVGKLKDWGFDPASAAIPASASTIVNAEELAELQELSHYTAAPISNLLNVNNSSLSGTGAASPAASSSGVLGADMIKGQSGTSSVRLSARTKEAMSEIDKEKNFRVPPNAISSRKPASSASHSSEQSGDLEQKLTQFLTTMLASSSSGLLARLPLHPLDTIKAQMQVQTSSHGKGVVDQLRSVLRTQGIAGLYRGIGITALGSMPAGCLFFTSYELAKQLLPNNAAGILAAGLCAEAASCVLWVPIDVIKERLQVQHTFVQGGYKYKGSVDAIRTISKTEGFKGIYRGYAATLLSFGPYSALYLMFYEKLVQIMADDKKNLSTYQFMIAGASAGGIAAFLTNPLDMAKLRIQVERSSAEGVFKYRNIFQGVKSIMAKEGTAGLFKGVFARICFASPAAALTITLYEEFKQFYGRLLS